MTAAPAPGPGRAPQPGACLGSARITPPMDHPPRSEARSRLRAWLAALVLVLAVLAVYWPSLDHGFVNFDDDITVTDNPTVRGGLTWEGVARAFSLQGRTYWHPLTTVSLMLNMEMHGPDPGDFHATNLVLHALAAALLLAAFLRMTRTLGPSFLVAAVFALHPMHVESVAWITERKDVLAGVFWAATLLAYAWHAQRPGPGRLAVVGASLLLGLLSKPVLVTLPLVLLLLDLWPLGRLSLEDALPAWTLPGRWLPRLPGRHGAEGRVQALARKKDRVCAPGPKPDGPGQEHAEPAFPAVSLRRALTEKALLLVPCLAVGLAVWASHPRLSGPLEDPSLGLRLGNALVSVADYLGRYVWPSGLAVHHPLPDSLSPWAVAAALALVLALTAAALAGLRRRPWLAVGWLWFLTTLAPALKVYRMGLWYALADRFAYIPYIGLTTALAFGLAQALDRRPRFRPLAAGAAALWLGALGLAASGQVASWRDSVSLFEQAVAVHPDNPLARANLAAALLARGRPGDLDRAGPHLAETLRLRPDLPLAWINQGLALVRSGQADQAQAAFRRALDLDPASAEALAGWATALTALGRPTEALERLDRSLALRPDQAAAWFNRGTVLRGLGRFPEAGASFEQALALNPHLAEAEISLAQMLLAAGHPALALKRLERAVDLAPDLALAQMNLGLALAQNGRLTEALGRLERAVALAPDLPEARINLGLALRLMGREKEAEARFQEARRLARPAPEPSPGKAQHPAPRPQPARPSPAAPGQRP